MRMRVIGLVPLTYRKKCKEYRYRSADETGLIGHGVHGVLGHFLADQIFRATKHSSRCILETEGP